MASLPGTGLSGQKPSGLNQFSATAPGTGSLRTGHSLAHTRQFGDLIWVSQHSSLFATNSLGPHTAVLVLILFPVSHSHSPTAFVPSRKGCLPQQYSLEQGCSDMAPITGIHGAWGSAKNANAYVPPRPRDSDSGQGGWGGCSAFRV